MFGLMRRFLLSILLALSVAIPYLAMSDRLDMVRDKISGFFSSSSDATELALDPVTGEIITRSGAPANGTNSAVASPPVVDLREVVRFDLTPRWIMERWPRVSSVPSDGRFDGLRVPLVTGTGAHDLAGSLTYYFDKSQQMQRLMFHGYTGDDRPLVSLITQYYRLQPEPAVGAGVFVARWNAKPTSALWIRRMPVVDAGNHHQKFEVILELNRPNYHASLSPQFENMLRHANAQHATGTGLR
jgi:hypothetical protein